MFLQLEFVVEVKQKKINNNNVFPYIYLLDIAKVDLSSIVILNFNNFGFPTLVSGLKHHTTIYE